MAPSLDKVEVARPQIPPGPLKTLVELVTKFHMEYSLYTSDQVAEVMRKPHDDIAILLYKRMDHDQLWLDCAQKLADMSVHIIESAKRVPGFDSIPREDQMVQLKEGIFEISILRMSRYLDPLTGYIMYGEVMIPSEAFTTADISERKLVNNIFDIAKSIAELKLTESELTLYQICVLFSPDRPGVRSVRIVQYINRFYLEALRRELDKNHKLPYIGDVRTFDFLMAKLTDLRDASLLHKEVLAKFLRFSPHLDFPEFYKELYFFSHPMTASLPVMGVNQGLVR